MKMKAGAAAEQLRSETAAQSGVPATAAATLLGYVLAAYVLEFPYRWNGWVRLLAAARAFWA